MTVEESQSEQVGATAVRSPAERLASFDEAYRRDADPWSFATDPYELQRYQHVMQYVTSGGNAFEPGCSVGVLTRQLADRCEHVTACDASPTAVALARQRCADVANVALSAGVLPGDLPDGPFDTVVFSELGYYFHISALTLLCQRLERLVAGGGRLIAVHWIGTSPDHVLHGDQVHRVLSCVVGLHHIAHERVQDLRRDGFVLDVWERTEPVR